jgi:hypothetical protein
MGINKRMTVMKGMITAFDQYRGWGFIESDGVKYFFHVKNSPHFPPALGVEVEFETAPPFKLGQKQQAVALRVAQTAQEGGEGGGE